MKCNGSLEGAKLKAEPIKDDDGNVIAHDSFWMVTLKVPARSIDANQLHRMVDENLNIEVNPVQGSLDLTEVRVFNVETGEVANA